MHMANPAETILQPPAEKDQVEAGGPRKLVRPRLADKAPQGRQRTRRVPAALLAHQELALTAPLGSVRGTLGGAAHGGGAAAGGGPGGGHAETLYLQKQMQGQTTMVFVLDDEERIEGVIEWYDLHVIKVRHATRTMIYKSSIKYIFKASDARAGDLRREV